MAPAQPVALITGAAQGIGKAIARRLLREGYRVVIADIDDEAGMETVAEYAALGDIAFRFADVSRADDVDVLIRETVNHFGGLSALVNNAGIGRGMPVTDLTLDDWNRVIGVNLTSIFLTAKYAVPHLRAAGGAIVNIASTRALMSEPNTEAYAASKGGVVAITHALAISIGPDVRVNCISPGWIETGPWRKASRRREPQHSDADRAQHPAGRVGTPDDIAALAAYLLGPEAGFITGQNVVADGGMTRKMIYVE